MLQFDAAAPAASAETLLRLWGLARDQRDRRAFLRAQLARRKLHQAIGSRRIFISIRRLNLGLSQRNVKRTPVGIVISIPALVLLKGRRKRQAKA